MDMLAILLSCQHLARWGCKHMEGPALAQYGEPSPFRRASACLQHVTLPALQTWAVRLMFVLCSPHFGIAHALCLGLAPWMAAEIPYMADANIIQSKA